MKFSCSDCGRRLNKIQHKCRGTFRKRNKGNLRRVDMIDWDKPIQTRDGRKARVICMDRKSPDRLTHVVLIDGTKEENWQTVTKDGHYWPSGSEIKDDIINVPEEHEIEMTICKQGLEFCGDYSNVRPCTGCGGWDMIAKKKITIKEGEGL